MKVRWTDAKLKAVDLPAGKSDMRTAIEPGLYLRVRSGPAGTSRTFEYRAMVNGKRRYLALGSLSPLFGLHEARKRLVELQAGAALARAGEADHPVIAERFKRQGKRSDPTFDELFAEFVEDRRLGSRRKGGSPVRERTIAIHGENYRRDIAPKIGDAKVSTITRDALESIVKAPLRRGSPGAAAQAYRTLRALVRFAIEQGRLTADPMAGMSNPRPYQAPRSSVEVIAADDRQIKALFLALADSAVSESVRLVIELQLLTGCRPTEARLAELGEFSLSAARWVVPAARSKTGRPFEVHLSEQAVDLVRRAKKLPRVEGSYLFPGLRGGKMETMAVARALSRITDRMVEAGGRKLRPHDLRRTVRTMMSRLGVEPHVAERCLGHLQRDVLTRVYDGFDYRPAMADAWNRVGAHLAALKTGGAEVVRLRA